ncbi:HTH DNA-binding protein [Methanosarcina siciliae T4/M]|uniref:UPF0251 protein MSSIH_2981 n=2 Tax=Methanosarcina siciliae TaxID=38027 RepID=A0A0E3LBF3_9EURY|nr:HTH DNA-binding protein [Methanosarcina siciliae T4/M]AKB33671.1 HTH DNA-binding protein [Methanosarcina siciliae HI350]
MVNKVKRRVSCFPKATYYKPREIPLCCLEIANLSIEELEAIRLCDLLQIEQNEAADRMGVSRKTFWSDLQRARQKVADALVNGKAIEISGGEYINTGECRVNFLCKECDHMWEPKFDQARPANCPSCGSSLIFRLGGDGRGKRFVENDYCCPKEKGSGRNTDDENKKNDGSTKK